MIEIEESEGCPAFREKWGMDPWRDIFDWLSGHPSEVARLDNVPAFYRQYDFTLERMATVYSRHDCNEYVFRVSSVDS